MITKFMDQNIFLYKYFSFVSIEIASISIPPVRRFCLAKLKLNPKLNIDFALSAHRNHSGYGLFFVWHGHEKTKHAQKAPINFVKKRARPFKSGFSCIENGSIKSTSRISKYKAHLSKKNTLQIINQMSETISRKQLLVSVVNLRFAHALSPKVSLYGSSRFYRLSPWGLQIYDWQNRIQVFDLYPVTYDFPQRNQGSKKPYFFVFDPLLTNRRFVSSAPTVQSRFYKAKLCFRSPFNKYNPFVEMHLRCKTEAKDCHLLFNRRLNRLAKRPQKYSNTIILSISGGQDSIFLLFCLSFLQSQIPFKPKIIWCNHFWQKGSFYTTLHLTKSAMAFSSPIMGFLPFHMATSPQLYQIVRTSFYSGDLRIKKNQNKVSTLCKSFLKKQSKYEKNTKNRFYEVATKWRKKKPKAYKKFIKEISETRARNWRHITIERACTFYGSTLCLNGHTLSDRVETILFNLIRGTKKKDFQALPWKRRHSTFCYNQFYPTFKQVIKSTHIHFI